jgi:hypothetical protein
MSPGEVETKEECFAGGDELAGAWLGDSNASGEWINAYHGTSPDAAPNIARAGLRRGGGGAGDDDGVEVRNGATFG